MKPLFEDLRTEEQRALAETVRRFVSAELRPYLAVSPPDEFPRRLFSRLCAMGLGGIPFPAEYGGEAPTTRRTLSFSRSWPSPAARSPELFRSTACLSSS